MSQPINELELAYQNAHLGIEETVEYFRLLRECNLVFLAPYHPEIEGENKVGTDGQMVLTAWSVNAEDVIPIFTSVERADEAMTKRGQPNERYVVGEMIGKELMKGFAPPHNRLRVMMNPGCSCGSRFMDGKMIASILDGSALYIPTPGEQAMNGLVISLPAGQPAILREPLGKFLRSVPEARAAWLFYEENPKPPAEKCYVFALLLEGGDPEMLKRDAALAIESVCPPEWRSRALLIDPKDPGFEDVIACVIPFYSVPAFKPVKKK